MLIDKIICTKGVQYESGIEHIGRWSPANQQHSWYYQQYTLQVLEMIYKLHMFHNCSCTMQWCKHTEITCSHEPLTGLTNWSQLLFRVLSKVIGNLITLLWGQSIVSACVMIVKYTLHTHMHITWHAWSCAWVTWFCAYKVQTHVHMKLMYEYRCMLSLWL